ncbi:RING-H2 finger protein ATL1-like [Henckelia pumila]|uniref:RING-H2 finger protein ATL1-like n=1 Tax=Henckelia pumila TaxID=405737 RepID=UPI003C6E298A
MGDPPTPQPISPPSSPHQSNFPMFYYGLLVVGTAIIILALYKIIVVRWCVDFDIHGSHLASTDDPGPMSNRGFHNLHVNFVTSFIYKKDEGDDDMSCAVCLCVFEEGEEIRQLPNCKHSFHATCIDLWLYSHMDCPLCRSTVEPPGFQRRLVFQQPVNSRDDLLFPGALV